MAHDDHDQPLSPVGSALRALAGLSAAAIAGWLLYSRFGIDHEKHLPLPVSGEALRFRADEIGFLQYYVQKGAAGRPLLLIHSINAAASAYEMRPLFEAYRSTRPVYALDLPGFGFSERANRRYTPELYTQAILAMLERIGEPCDVIAFSLSSEFAARAALQRPDLIASLALISPTGLSPKTNGDSAWRRAQAAIAHGFFAFPLWSQGFYDLLTTRRSLHAFLQLGFVGKVDEGLEGYDYGTAHQPGARHAPLYFISRQLFTRDIFDAVYMQLTTPTLILYDEDAYSDFDWLLPLTRDNPYWRAARIEGTRGLPHFERLGATTAALDAFWQKQ